MFSITSLRLIFLGSVLITITSCAHKSPRIIFVVPDDFQGGIKIQEDKKSGETATKDRAAITLSIPATGELTLQDTSFFYNWYNTCFRYTSEETLYCSDEPTTPDSPIRLFSTGSVADGDGPQTLLFYVGTLDGLFEYQNSVK